MESFSYRFATKCLFEAPSGAESFLIKTPATLMDFIRGVLVLLIKTPRLREFSLRAFLLRLRRVSLSDSLLYSKESDKKDPPERDIY